MITLSRTSLIKIIISPHQPINPIYFIRKIQKVSVTDEIRVVAAITLEVRTPSLFIFLAIIKHDGVVGEPSIITRARSASPLNPNAMALLIKTAGKTISLIMQLAIVGLIFLIALLVLIGIFLIHTIVIMIKPELSHHISSIKNLEELLEDLEQNERRVEGFYVGNRAIVSMNTPLMIADRNDVLAAWNSRRGTYNNEKVSLAYVCTSTRTIKVPMPLRGSELHTKYLKTLAAYCPNCKIGAEADMQKYIKFVRERLN